jgi:hypothetical protein
VDSRTTGVVMHRSAPLAAATIAALVISFAPSAGSSSVRTPPPAGGPTTQGTVVGAEQGTAARGVPTVIAWSPSPRNVPPILDRVESVAVAAGDRHDLALTRGGTVVGWGRNGHHQADVPVALDGVPVRQVAVGQAHSLVLTAAGAVVAWGWNRNHQADVPVTLDGEDVTQVAAGGRHSLALTADGTVVAWGSNRHGQTDVPVALDGVVVTQVAAGQARPARLRSVPSHSLALTADGSVVGWGSNGHGQADVPVTLDGEDVTQVAAGGRHSLALTAAGNVVAWGTNGRGQTQVPARLEGVTVIQVAAGDAHSLALTAAGNVVAWGGRTRQRAARVPAVLDAVRVTEIAAGGRESLAIGRYEGPDLEISRRHLRQGGHYEFNNAYDTGGPIDLGGQGAWGEVVGESFCLRDHRRYFVRVHNDAGTTGRFRLRSTSPTPSRVRYHSAGADITRRLQSAAGYVLDIPPGRYHVVTMDLDLGPCPYPRPPSTKAFLTAQLVGHPLRVDRVKGRIHIYW